MLAVLSAARASSERDWLMILVAFSHGLRASEVIALTPDNVRDGFLDVQRLKGSDRTVQPLVGNENSLLDERKSLIDFASRTPLNQSLFGIGRKHFWRLFRRYAERAGIPAHKRHPHVLKHSIAAQTIDTAGIQNVRRYLGHKSLDSTGAYLEVSDEKAAAAIGAALKL